jgi:hypothetical protein
MVERLFALLGRADEDLQLLTCLGLADVVGQQLGRSARSSASSCGDWRAALTTRGPVGPGGAAKSSVWMPIQ